MLLVSYGGLKYGRVCEFCLLRIELLAFFWIFDFLIPHYDQREKQDSFSYILFLSLIKIHFSTRIIMGFQRDLFVCKSAFLQLSFLWVSRFPQLCDVRLIVRDIEPSLSVRHFLYSLFSIRQADVYQSVVLVFVLRVFPSYIPLLLAIKKPSLFWRVRVMQNDFLYLCAHHTTLSDNSEGNKGHKKMRRLLHRTFIIQT